jgi:hypothetical protein
MQVFRTNPLAQEIHNDSKMMETLEQILVSKLQGIKENVDRFDVFTKTTSYQIPDSPRRRVREITEAFVILIASRIEDDLKTVAEREARASVKAGILKHLETL